MTSEILQEYLFQRYPEWSNIVIHNFNDITSGWETEILSFDVAYTVNGISERHGWISRAYPGKTGVERSTSEYELLQILHSIDYPVPEVVLLETDSKWLGKPFIIMERINGATMWDLMQVGTEETTQEMVQMFSKLFVQLHDLDWSKFPKVPERYFKTNPKDMYKNVITGVRDWITRASVEYLVPLVDWLDEYYHEIEFDRYSIIHGDFHPMNILIGEEGSPFVIDWTASKLADYRSDIAWSLMLAFLYAGEEFRDVIIAGYESASGHKIQNLDYFMVEAAIRRFADILISLRDGAESLGM
ncbi:MAG: phosphotransferase, partial [Candidatus Thorarchaeota archaeon]